ncbi:serine hydroxymethyltransferas [Arthrobacter sp. Hiyo8]|nr:serine hydroxymethyltransferas [Arthrobacter sp. Hiyo8]
MIAAKAVAFKMAAEPEFQERQARVLEGAKLLAERLLKDDVAAAGISVVNGGTDVHLVLVDLRHSELDGQQAEDTLHRIGITVNRNAVPFDPGRRWFPPDSASAPGARRTRLRCQGIRGGRGHHRDGVDRLRQHWHKQQRHLGRRGRRRTPGEGYRARRAIPALPAPFPGWQRQRRRFHRT